MQQYSYFKTLRSHLKSLWHSVSATNGHLVKWCQIIFTAIQGPWVKWIPIDSGQAVLPTTHNNEETYPLGFAVTFAVTKQLEQGKVIDFRVLLSVKYKV